MNKSSAFFGGSRALGLEASPLVALVASLVLPRFDCVQVGDAPGADELFVEFALRLGAAASLQIHCAYDPPTRVFSHALFNGACLLPPLQIPYRARLAARTANAVKGCAAAFVVLGSGPSKGSVNAINAAVAAGAYVQVFTQGCALPPQPTPGFWAPGGVLEGFHSFTWVRSYLL